MRLLLVVLIAMVALYGAICAHLYLDQDTLIYYPTRDSEETLRTAAAAAGFLPWVDAQGQHLGWQSKDGDPQRTLLVFHGNARDALNRSYYLTSCRQAGDDRKIYLFEYPGYGARSGKPSEQSLTETAIAALDLLTAQPGHRVWLLGESLGSGVAAAVAAARPTQTAAVVLVTPFDTFVNAASAHYPWIPLSLLLHTRFDSVTNLKKYDGPVAFLLASDDSVVPAALGRRLFESYPGQKKLWEIPEATHNDVPLLLRDWTSVVRWIETQPARNPQS